MHLVIVTGLRCVCCISQIHEVDFDLRVYHANIFAKNTRALYAIDPVTITCCGGYLALHQRKHQGCGGLTLDINDKTLSFSVDVWS